MLQTQLQPIAVSRPMPSLQACWLRVFQAMHAMSDHAKIQRQARMQLSYHAQHMRPSIQRLFELIAETRDMHEAQLVLQHFIPAASPAQA